MCVLRPRKYPRYILDEQSILAGLKVADHQGNRARQTIGIRIANKIPAAPGDAEMVKIMFGRRKDCWFFIPRRGGEKVPLRITGIERTIGIGNYCESYPPRIRNKALMTGETGS